MEHFVDCHCHLADPRMQDRLAQVIDRAQARGLRYFVQAGYGPEDWHRQFELAQQYPNQIIPVVGLHPMWVADHSEDEAEQALNQLGPYISQVKLLGEMGLDYREKIVKGSEARQISAFEQQLELAQFAQKPIVLHIVRAHQEAWQILDLYGVPKAGGFVHAFNGAPQLMHEYLKRGLMISVGGALTYDKNNNLKKSVMEIPLERLLVESDSPDQKPQGFTGEYNEPSTIWDVAEKVGEIRGLDKHSVLRISKENMGNLLKTTWNSL